jgi:hypothetical protein
MHKLLPLLVSAMIGCSSNDNTERGPIFIDALWKAWETSDYHPDREAGYNEKRGDQKGGVIVEYFHIETPEVVVPPGSGIPTHLRIPVVDQFFCSHPSSDTCYQFDSVGYVLGRDSVLEYMHLQLIKDSRPIWRLTDSLLVLKTGSIEYAMKPSHRVLVDTSDGKYKVVLP